MSNKNDNQTIVLIFVLCYVFFFCSRGYNFESPRPFRFLFDCQVYKCSCARLLVVRGAILY